MSSSNILTQVYGILEAERNSDELTNIPISIYLDITNYIKSKKNGFGKVPVTVPEMIITKEREMLSNMSEKIMNIRLSKAIQNNQENLRNLLTPEEKYALEPLIDASKRTSKLNRAIGEGRIAFIESLKEDKTIKYALVRFLEDSTSSIGVDSKTYGPFFKEDIAVLPIDNIKPLVNHRKVQELDVDL